MVYFAPEPAEEYAGLGLAGTRATSPLAQPARCGLSRVVIRHVLQLQPRRWSDGIPSGVVAGLTRGGPAARLRGGDRALRSMLTGADVESAEIRRGIRYRPGRRRGGCPAARGRPLFAPMPPCPGRPTRTWCCGTRNPCCANTAAMGTSRPSSFTSWAPSRRCSCTPRAGTLRAPPSRRPGPWGDSRWAESLATLQGRGVLSEGDDLVLTDEGVETAQPDRGPDRRAGGVALRGIGEDGSARLRQLVRPYSQTVARLAYRACSLRRRATAELRCRSPSSRRSNGCCPPRLRRPVALVVGVPRERGTSPVPMVGGGASRSLGVKAGAASVVAPAPTAGATENAWPQRGELGSCHAVRMAARVAGSGAAAWKRCEGWSARPARDRRRCGRRAVGRRAGDIGGSQPIGA